MTTTTVATEEAAVTSVQSLGGANGLSPEAVRADAAALFERHLAVVEGVCRHMLRDGDEAQDAVQDTFLAAFRALLAGTRPRDPEAWLATIARNECLRRIRARMREPLALTAEPEDRVADVHELATTRAAATLLWREIAQLPPHQREAVVLRELGGRSYDQVAEELGVSTGAVESLLFRARGRLRGRLRVRRWGRSTSLHWRPRPRDCSAARSRRGSPRRWWQRVRRSRPGSPCSAVARSRPSGSSTGRTAEPPPLQSSPAPVQIVRARHVAPSPARRAAPVASRTREQKPVVACFRDSASPCARGAGTRRGRAAAGRTGAGSTGRRTAPRARRREAARSSSAG